MAYDWIYPPRQGGEALIHVDWGNDYELKKPYWLFRQWAAPLAPGMRVVEATVAAAAKVKPTAFVSADGRTLIVHLLNAGDADQSIMLSVAGRAGRAAPASRHRTSATEDSADLPPVAPTAWDYADALPPRSMTTYRITIK